LERVVIATSRHAARPLRVRVGADGPLLPALSRALIGLRAGTRASVLIPAEVAYDAAARAAAGIPPGAALEAEVRIRSVLP
jgi:FKBP-type peptidyl-prolyl cis-trans isomerase